MSELFYHYIDVVNLGNDLTLVSGVRPLESPHKEAAEKVRLGCQIFGQFSIDASEPFVETFSAAEKEHCSAVSFMNKHGAISPKNVLALNANILRGITFSEFESLNRLCVMLGEGKPVGATQ